jgi:hypothetical protein
MAKDLVRKVAQLPTQNIFEKDAGAGLEGITTADLAIPFLSILQTNSPQLDRAESSYIKGAVAGQIFNSVSSKIYDSVEVIPCAFIHRVVEWKPRGTGGGLVAQYNREEAPDDVTLNDKGQMQRSNGNMLIATAYHYVLIVEEGEEPEQAVLPMSSTQLKKSKKWNSLMAALKMKAQDGEIFTPPTYSHSYTLTTSGESNDKGKWFGWVISNGKLLQDSKTIVAARAFSKSARNISLKPASDESVM